MGRLQADPSPAYHGQQPQQQFQQPASNIPAQPQPQPQPQPQQPEDDHYQHYATDYDQQAPTPPADTLDGSYYTDEYPQADSYQQDPSDPFGAATNDTPSQPQHQQPAMYPPQQNPQMVQPRTPPRTSPPPPPQGQPQVYPPTKQAEPVVQFPPAATPLQHSHVNNNYQANAAALQFPPQPPQAVYQQQPAGQQYMPQVNFQQQQMGMQQGSYAAAMPASPYKPSAEMGIPVQNQFPNQQQQGWSTGLFDCMDNPENAIITACFPCLTFGQIAEIIDNGHTTCGTSGLLYGAIAFFVGLPFLISCTYRTKLRSRYALEESPAPDWLTHCLCECCALCQEYRELQNRGFDPAIGWQGNLARNQSMQQQMGMMPPMNQTMMG